MSNDLIGMPLTHPLHLLNLRTLAGAGPTVGAGAGEESAALRAAQDFEAVLTGQLVEQMRSTLEDSGLLESAGGKQMQDLFWHHLGQQVAKGGGLGVWKQIYQQMKMQAGEPSAEAGGARLEHSA